MSKDLREKLLKYLDPGKEDRGVINFDRPGSVTVSVDRVLKSQREFERRQAQESHSSDELTQAEQHVGTIG